MGAVYLARQVRLNREVALKVILEGARAAPENRARFKAEAEAVARLHHPNIVQIFEFGEDQEGLFLALEFVDGPSLQKAAAGQPQPPRHAAQLVHTLAAALQFAHDRGIVHRDLKPSNILLAATGEPKIADFGLARDLRQPSDKTLTGAVVGTPNYMAPEQAAGGAKNAGPAADIYALGAILYWLLVGRPPFHADSVLEILRQVVEHEPPSVRLLNPKLDRDLDTICMKCLQKDPDKRYATAGDLASDVARYLGGEPITARPVGRLERLDRWRRRNPRVAALTAALIGVFLTGFAAVTWQWLETARHREVAEENFAWATSAVSDLTSVSENRLLDERGLQPLRREILERALRYYETFAANRRGHTGLQQDLAEAHYNIGKIQNLLGDKDLAIASLQKSVEIHERLRAGRDSEYLRRAVATVYGQLAQVKESIGDLDAAARLYDAACELLRASHDANPQDAGIELELADYRADRAFLEIRRGNFEEGLEGVRQAVGLHQELHAAHPQDREVRTRLAAVLNNWGLAQRRAGQLESALDSYSEAVGIQAALNREFPDVIEFQEDTAMSHFNLGSVQGLLGRSEDAASSFEAAGAAYRSLQTSNPAVPQFRQGEADCLSEIAYLRIGEQKFDQAEASLLQAIGVLEKLVEQAPSAVSYLESLRNAYGVLVTCQYAQGDPQAALDYLLKAADVQTSIVQRTPEVPEAADGQADMYNNLGILHRELGNLDEALMALDRALAIKESLALRFPDVGDYRSAIGRIHANRAECFAARNELDQAIASYDAATREWRQLIEQHPSRWKDRDALATALTDAAAIHARAGRHDEARRKYQAAVEGLSSLVEESDDATFRFNLARAWHNYGELEHQQSDLEAARANYTRAASIFEELVRDTPDDPANLSALITSHVVLGDLAARDGDHSAAATWYTSVIDQVPRLRELGGEDAEIRQTQKHALLGRASALTSLERDAEAADDVSRASELEAGDVE
jgi:tetratricopeptide (TPR) repeat protein/tRNA A-37 threonylcarbamoyl transferase component Bud32